VAEGFAGATPGAGAVPGSPARRTMRVKVLSPARAVFDGEALDVVLPAFDGEWGVLANHAPMVAELAIGCLRVTKPDGTGEAFAICGGFAEIRDNTVTVLSPDCRGPGELTPELIDAELGKVAETGGVPVLGEQARHQAWGRACRLAMSRRGAKGEG